MLECLATLGLASNNIGVGNGTDHRFCQADAETLVSYNPTTDAPLAECLTATMQDYEQLMITAVEAARHWRTVPAPERGNIVREIGASLREQKTALARLITLEMGKPLQESLGEVQEMIDMADFAVGQARMLYGKTMHSERPRHRMYEQWHPLGVVGVISAFNFPVAVWSWNAFIAAICGNVVVWKPSSKTPLCALAVQELCDQVMRRHQLPAIFSTFISADAQLAEHFVADDRVALLSFTGSTAVGKTVNQTVAARMGRCLLELGGNNALIVDETADLALALPAIAFGAVGTCGQRCTTTRRVFIHESRFDSLCQALQHAYASVTIGDPLSENTLMGPLVDAAAVRQYQQALEQIKAQGGELLYGGNVLEGSGHFVEPVLVKAVATMAILQQETFAPILYLIPYTDFEAAISANNAVRQGLSSALFTKDLQRAEYFLSALGSDCGIANVNIGTSGAEIGGAFGGEKETGGGREAGSDAWKAYMRRQTSTINWGSQLPLAQGITFNLTAAS